MGRLSLRIFLLLGVATTLLTCSGRPILVDWGPGSVVGEVGGVTGGNRYTPVLSSWPGSVVGDLTGLGVGLGRMDWHWLEFGWGLADVDGGWHSSQLSSWPVVEGGLAGLWVGHSSRLSI